MTDVANIDMVKDRYTHDYSFFIFCGLKESHENSVGYMTDSYLSCLYVQSPTTCCFIGAVFPDLL